MTTQGGEEMDRAYGLVSEGAAALIELVGALPEQTLRDCERLLLAGLASPSGAELREARLGLLMAMIADGTGEIPRTDDYDALRRTRVDVGEHWPSSSTLAKAYSRSWLTAVRSAMRLLADGPASRVPHTLKHTQDGCAKPYARREVHAAVQRFRKDHGRWPAATQFYDWGEQLRRAARSGGHPDPRIPTRPALKSHFASFDDALVATKLLSDLA